MGWKLTIALVSVLFIFSLIFFYFLPMKTISFGTNPEGNANFTASESNAGMQFYPNMRFPETTISYKISGCPLQKQNDMETAFKIMEDSTLLQFYPSDNGGEISITCEERERHAGKLFIAGEGGPTNITAIGDYAVILNGEILLIRESKCPKPTVALHELLHVLGFEHSANPQNIMYNISNCEQTIGDDIIELINKLYSVPSYTDLQFKNVSAKISGRFLDVGFSVINAGFKESGAFSIGIYADGSIVKEVSMDPIGIGYGRIISMKNIWVSQIGVSELELAIDSEFSEISKTNNKIKLEIKND